MKFIKIIIIVFVLILVCFFAISFLGGYLRSTKFVHQIAIQGSYIDYNCGELCVALKVEAVNDKSFFQIIGLPVYPYKNNENIENFITENLDKNKGLFCLKGYLHKRNKGFLRLFVAGYEGYPMEVTSIEKLLPGQPCKL